MRPRFFSKYEWWYHLAMMPVLFAVGNNYFIGTEYFNNFKIFWIGTALVFILYWFSIVTLTVAVRWVIARFPDVKQTKKRLIVMLLLVGSMTVVLAAFDVWAYSIIPVLDLEFGWEALWPILVLGGFFDVFLCAALGLFYSFERWKASQTESEKLERLALQHQFNTLKGQVNPHFLFNSLNTLSSLISEDSHTAENFVEDLAKIYRYMLQAAKAELVPLGAELDFLRIYSRLLNTRYGNNLVIRHPTDPYIAEVYISPLSLQTLVDNAVKHNVMTTKDPLEINILILSDQRIRVQNTLRRKTRTVETNTAGLATLVEKYRLLTTEPVYVNETETYFIVTLPLLRNKVSVHNY